MPAPLLAPPPRAHAPVKQPRKKGPPSGLHIDTPAHNPTLVVIPADDSASTSALTSATDDSDSFQFPPPPASKRSRNMKKLSLSLSSAQSSSSSLLIPAVDAPKSALPEPSADRPRRLSAVSLPVPSTTAALLRKEEDGDSPTAPYTDGPIEILPKIWLGSEDNARNWPVLVERGIGAVLNVAREVVSPFDSVASRPLRLISSTPNLKDRRKVSQDTYYPAHKLSGRPGMHYLKLQWSHGQSDLVQRGFTDAMRFIDDALERGEGILIHCQLGISRSATLVIALVMRAAATRAPSVPSEVWDLKGMQGAYGYVKAKSKWVGPNMSLIYQLLDYERNLRADCGEPTSDVSDTAAQDEEWGRQRQMLDEASESEAEQESAEVQREARALDKAMEERMLARKSSSSSVGSGLGMGAAWRSRYSRKRAGSVASNVTSASAISEDLVEEDEEQELLGIGGGFDGTSISTLSTSTSARDETGRSEDSSDEGDGAQFATPMAAREGFGMRLQSPPLKQKFANVPPTAPAHRSVFGLPPPSATKSSFALPPVPATASRASFKLPPVPKTASVSSFDHASLSRTPSAKSSSRRRPAPIGILPTVPDSPLQNIIVEQPIEPLAVQPSVQETPLTKPRQRKESRKPMLPPLHLRHTSSSTSSTSSVSSSRSVVSTHSSVSGRSSSSSQMQLATPSTQTLFVFPPSPTQTARTPSAMTLTSSAVPFPAMLSTPRVSQMDKQGKRRSYIGILAPPTPTVSHSRVDARGWIGKH